MLLILCNLWFKNISDYNLTIGDIVFNLATITKSIALSAVVTVTVLGASNTYAAETNRLSSDIEIREFNR